jgi:phage terminase large subunit-like protein
MAAIVDIEWPLADGTDVAQTFFPSVRVYDGDSGAPVADHKIFFTLTKGASTFSATSGLIDPSLDMIHAGTSITTTKLGQHTLLAILKDGGGVEVDRDEEDGINITTGGASKRESLSSIIEE